MSTNSIILVLRLFFYSLSDLNRYSFKESDFKSDVYTNSTKRALNISFFIPQFDFITIGAQVFGLLITLYFFYYYSISTVIQYFIEIKKIRNKKLDKNFKLITNIKNDLKFNLWSINYSYKQFIK
jgi:hypothetical protein